MASVTPVDSLPTVTREASARVSGPIVEEFVQSGNRYAKVDGLEAKAASTKAILQKYANTRQHPVKVSIRSGEVYLERTDMNGEG